MMIQVQLLPHEVSEPPVAGVLEISHSLYSLLRRPLAVVAGDKCKDSRPSTLPCVAVLTCLC